MLKVIMSTISFKNFNKYRPPSTIELTFDIANMIMRLKLSKLGFGIFNSSQNVGCAPHPLSVLRWLIGYPVSRFQDDGLCILTPKSEINLSNDRKVLPSPPTTLIVRRKNLNDLQLKTISHTFPRIKGLYSPLRTWDYFATGHLKSFERFLSLLRMESSQKYERKYTKIRKILMGPAFNGMISWVTTTEQTWW